ncbi:predicted protein [Histoplasma mississippiense (nom. inval.)]|uniref:predicted protein n=1 Tax=Ajellomyces capsulatus (strain NAm1 / WU24) TaxID=2059318 RepID=UPI000157B6FE|nr:predicted protein [Histoplasma mississippiense (nom. inval.)]EDN03861.1 predicted protein [Histoplasma mississippiense (nom. inval.)]
MDVPSPHPKMYCPNSESYIIMLLTGKKNQKPTSGANQLTPWPDSVGLKQQRNSKGVSFFTHPHPHPHPRWDGYEA